MGWKPAIHRRLFHKLPAGPDQQSRLQSQTRAVEAHAAASEIFEQFSGHHDSIADVLHATGHHHLPQESAQIAAWCRNLAEEMIAIIPDDPQLSTGLHQLLDARDSFLRAALHQKDQ